MERKTLKKSRNENSNIPTEKESSEKFDRDSNRKPKVVRSWDQIPSYLRYQPVIEHHITQHKNGYEIAFVVDGEVEYILDERKFAKPNRRQKKKEV